MSPWYWVLCSVCIGLAGVFGQLDAFHTGKGNKNNHKEEKWHNFQVSHMKSSYNGEIDSYKEINV